MKTAHFGIAALSLVLSQAASAGAPPKVTPALIEAGKTSFTTNCVTCHGEAGDGNGPAGQYMNPKPRNFAVDKFKAGDKPAQIFKTLTKGLAGTAMASFGHLPENERWALAHYVATFRKPAPKK